MKRKSCHAAKEGRSTLDFVVNRELRNAGNCRVLREASTRGWTEADRSDALLTAWRDDYLAQFPQHAERCQFFATAAGPPMVRIA